MRRRLYFMLPDLAEAERALRDLLLARIEVGHIHFLGKRDMPMGDLPEATFLQKTDLIHGAGTGMILGGLVGVIGGGLLVLFPPGQLMLPLGTILATALFGVAFGIWVASMVGSSVPNSRHAAFQQAIEQGKILMMVDVPLSRKDEISDLLSARHPEAQFRGTEPTIPSFP
ncbi:MAG TPA: DUF1269 domain-containing protein [Burkholderiales bacterium]|nr:DUF1269 domain-containing protein [Burkholderiales bacterium]